MPSASLFRRDIQLLDEGFIRYCTTSTTPLPTPGLIMDDEFTYQAELYLPGELLSHIFRRLVHTACPSHTAATILDQTMGWINWCRHLWRHGHPEALNPADFLQKLLENGALLTSFIFSVTMPYYHNGKGFDRYPEQHGPLLNHLKKRLDEGNQELHLLDMGCGSGEGTWELLSLANEAGWTAQQVQCVGVTAATLEVWAAENRCLPHLQSRTDSYRQRTDILCSHGWQDAICFQQGDVLQEAPLNATFDIILCNGLLGGPALNQKILLDRALQKLGTALRHRGLLCIGDRFHGGWHQTATYRCRQEILRDKGFIVNECGGSLFATTSAN